MAKTFESKRTPAGMAVMMDAIVLICHDTRQRVSKGKFLFL
ncbi:hypothetical protein [Desulfomonile tiedjei]|nr:hypothetical protein [Desulfomonile tiedjei]